MRPHFAATIEARHCPDDRAKSHQLSRESAHSLGRINAILPRLCGCPPRVIGTHRARQFIGSRASTLQLNGEVHAWFAKLDGLGLSARTRVLSEEERLRAARFSFDRDRDRFVATRIVLRLVVSHYLSTAPETVCFKYSPFGKPSLATHEALQFSISHSKDLAVIAVSDSAIGVDVEYVHEIPGLDRVMETVCTGDELRQLAALSPPDRLQGFLRCWTRKEAYVKALGEGLSMDLRTLEVWPVHPALQRADRLPVTITDLPVPEEYFGSAATVGSTVRVCTRWFTPGDF